MYEAAARNLRTAERFLLEPPLSGHFGASVVAVCDISAKGARIRHGHAVEMGQKSALRLAVDGRQSPVALESVVVWTTTHAEGGKNKFLSGLRTYGSPEMMNTVLTQLQKAKRTTRIEELRSADRFQVTPPLDAGWNDLAVRVEDLSARGARIELRAPAEVGERGTLHFAVPSSPLDVEVAGHIMWAAMKSVEPPLYRAGVMITEKPEVMRLAIGQLCESVRAALDTYSLTLKLKIIRARARQLAPEHHELEASGIPAEQFLLIQGVREELRLNPEEAMHWYRRARLTISDPSTRSIAPAIADHPDALAVWEYLDRSIDPSIIGRTFDLPR